MKNKNTFGELDMTFSNKETVGLKKAKLSDSGIQELNKLLLTEEEGRKKRIPHKYFTFLCIIVGLFIITLFSNSTRIDNLATFSSILLPIVTIIFIAFFIIAFIAMHHILKKILSDYVEAINTMAEG